MPTPHTILHLPIMESLSKMHRMDDALSQPLVALHWNRTQSSTPATTLVRYATVAGGSKITCTRVISQSSSAAPSTVYQLSKTRSTLQTKRLRQRGPSTRLVCFYCVSETSFKVSHPPLPSFRLSPSLAPPKPISSSCSALDLNLVSILNYLWVNNLYILYSQGLYNLIIRQPYLRNLPPHLILFNKVYSHLKHPNIQHRDLRIR